jgi:hydrogenase nickel incorporation protein HypA/HybF
MHEASLMKNLMDKILEISAGQGAKRVLGVKVKLGALSHMSPEHFKEHFTQAALGTPAEGAHLQAEQLHDIHDPMAQEILLESVEIEENP